jgi:thiol-disulfide isomerase/thioredoxin
MRAKILLISIVLCLPILMACKPGPENTVTISGTFTNLPTSRLLIYQLLPASKPLIDSVTTDAEGKFTVSFEVEKAGYYSLMQDANNGITLVISPGEKIILKGDGRSLRNTYSVQGSKDSELFAEYNRFTNDNLKQVDSLSAIFTESRLDPDFQKIKTGLDSAYLRIFDNQKDKVVSFVNSYPNSLASLLVISENFGPNTLLSEKTHAELFFKLDSALIQAYPENSLVNTFHLRMLDLKAEIADIKKYDSLLMPGMPAPEIILPDATGMTVKLTSLKGKLTLVYFWSSWDAPSRQTNMNLNTLYAKFKKQGFEIYAVSVDSDADLWQKACLIDRAYWVNVIDTQGLASDVSKTFGIKALPNLILIGEDGTIIARQPEFKLLEKLIKENI